MPEGAVVRIRRLTPAVGMPVIRAVIEVDRRTSGPHGIGANRKPPPLMAVEGDSDLGVVAALLPYAEEDTAVARLLASRKPA